MTHAIIYKKSSDDVIVGFKTEGHAGFANAGEDIVCAAISILVINTINSIEKFTDSDCKVTADEDKAVISLMLNSSNNMNEVQVLLKSLDLGLRSIASNNPDYLSITVKEV